jgi:hypothetical protein
VRVNPNDEELREWAARWLVRHPEGLLRLEDEVWDIAHEESVEPDPDELRENIFELAVTVLMIKARNMQALMDEFLTDEQIETFTREEAARNRDPETKLISGDVVKKAVTTRILHEFGQYVPGRFK